MFKPTNNPYRFKYLITGITGTGIKEVYLPPEPPDEEVLFQKEQKFVRPIIPSSLQDGMDELVYERNRKDRNGTYVNPDFVHPHQDEINEWEDREWERSTNGIWFWNNGVKTFITGEYYKYLTTWDAGFNPEYRETDKETFYWIKFWEEDPKSYGGTYNTRRREGKSTKMGFWIMNRSSTKFQHLGGMQGEDNIKIKDFYDKMVMAPFYKMPYYFQPTYDTTTLQKKGVIFNEPPKRNQKRMRATKPVLESMIDYRTSEEGKYDGAKLHSYVMEEPGKTLSANVSKRWGLVKPSLTDGVEIIGKAFLGTTAEFMDTMNKGGKAYQKVVFESDYDVRDENGETTSGLYSAMMPAECTIKGFFDEWGIPKRAEAMRWIHNRRKAKENNPSDYATEVRQYPTNWDEVFYISAEHCEFNIVILEARKAELQLRPIPVRKLELKWKNNIRFSQVHPFDSPNGWFKTAWYPHTEQEMKWLNNVEEYNINGQKMYKPKNDSAFAAGCDPIDHGVVVESSMGTDGFVSNRRSRPVLTLKRRYDSAIDGVLSQELMEERAKERYQYKTGKYFAMMDVRPNDPNVFFERALMVCWLFGVTLQVESQWPGILNWFSNAGCSEFTWLKYVRASDKPTKGDLVTHGTPASKGLTQEFTGLLATDVEYFGHTYPFIEMVEDLRIFNPLNTKPHDYSMAMGNTEIACQMRPKVAPAPVVKITDYFRTHRLPHKAIN